MGDTHSHYSCNKIYLGSRQEGEFLLILFPHCSVSRIYQNISFIQALTYRKFCKALWVDFGYWIHCLLDVTLDYHRHGHTCHHVSLEGHHMSSEVFLTLMIHVSLK